MHYLLEILVLRLLSIGLFWEGGQCDIKLYTLYVQPVTVQEGLCVFIPCNFTYDPNDARSTSKMYGYWFKGSCFESLSLVATNDPNKTIAENARNRFFLSEEVEEGNCSLVINDAQNNDGGNYCFRIEKDPKAKFNFRSELQVNVKELQDPAIEVSGNLRANHPVNITCTVPGSCVLKPPHISWKMMFRHFTPRTSERRPQVYTSVLDFIPSASDDGQKITCAVRYGTGTSQFYRERTINLNVRYPPQIVGITSEIMESKKDLTSFTDVTDSTQIVALHCKAKGNPSPNVTWVEETQSLGKFHLIRGSEWKFPRVQIQHTDTYKCRAENSEGVTEKTFWFAVTEVQGEPTAPGYFGSIVPLLLVLCLIKALLCFFFFISIISLFTQRKAQVMKRLTTDIKKMQAAVPPEKEETKSNNDSTICQALVQQVKPQAAVNLVNQKVDSSKLESG
ncbi:sialic acid-binding Ig-like lectin 12 [Anolis carolinensis]|uniref:sialic acid-binding Ig-like lectin 12 n=1 Tax=Anolis carolinensis TaxID=28377 RepID=UPI002F2B5ED8